MEIVVGKVLCEVATSVMIICTALAVTVLGIITSGTPLPPLDVTPGGTVVITTGGPSAVLVPISPVSLAVHRVTYKTKRENT